MVYLRIDGFNLIKKISYKQNFTQIKLTPTNFTPIMDRLCMLNAYSFFCYILKYNIIMERNSPFFDNFLNIIIKVNSNCLSVNRCISISEILVYI